MTKRRKALEYAKVADCLSAVQASGAGLSAKLAFELLVLTANRSGEVRLARWAQIDWQAEGGPVWHRPSSVMKAKVPDTVPLSRHAVVVLEAAKALGPAVPENGAASPNPHALIFPGTVPGKPLSDATLLKLVREQGYDIDIHGFRTSFRIWAQERTNIPREIAEAALAHTIKDKAEAAFSRSSPTRPSFGAASWWLSAASMGFSARSFLIKTGISNACTFSFGISRPSCRSAAPAHPTSSTTRSGLNTTGCRKSAKARSA